jgi:predicted TIM-barrel fold metal-dependent hydrolase
MRDSAWGFPIVDFHCHFPVPDPAPPPADEAYRWRHGDRKLAELKRNWRWYQEQWWDQYSFPYPEETEPGPEIQAGRWSAEIEHGQLDAVAFVTGGGNRVLADAIRDYPRMIGFAHHDPFSPGAPAELRRAVTEDGLRGYKVLAPALPGAIDDEALLPVWQAAEDLGIPVLVHFGPLDGGGGTAAHENISPLKLHDVAKAFPYTTFVVPHFGCGYPGDLLRLAWACRNVSVDTSGNNEWIRWMPYPLTLADLFRKFLETVGPERIIFGSDSAHFPRGLVRAYYDEQTRIVRQLGLSPGDRHLIFAANAARLLQLDLPGTTQA